MKFFLHLFSLLLCLSSAAQTLLLRPGFGNNGIVHTNLSNDAPYYAFASGQQSDGKLIIGGSTLLRTFTNGNIDSSFGSNGLAQKADYLQINSLAVQADDKIVGVLNDNSRVLLKRFTASGKIDSSFNGTGIASIAEAGKTIYISKVRLQPDGKILLAGSSFSAEKTSFFIARLSTDGTPDISFHSTGRLTLDLSGWDNAAADIATQSNGKLIVAGFTKNTVGDNPSLAVIRLNADGSLDTDFNSTGIVQYANASASLVKIYADDKILLAGTSQDQLLLVRLQQHGAFDTGFNGNGILTEAGLGMTQPKQLELLAGNNILVTGESSALSPFNFNYAAFKYDDAGNPLLSFNGTGKTYLDAPGNEYSAGSIVLNDESILVAGYTDNQLYASTALISSTGIFDNAYGTGGIKYLQVNGTDETGYSVLTQASGKIIAIGNKTDAMASVYNTVVIRYNTDGSIDSSFATAGVLNITEPNFVFHSAILQSDDKIILVGDKPGGDPDYIPNIAVIRLTADGSPDNSFGVNGVVLLPATSTSGYGKAAALTSDGTIIVGGIDATNSNTMLVWRLEADGSLYNAFGTAGKRTIYLGFETIGLGTVAIQPDNKVLLGGYFVESNNASSFFCLRLETNGDNDNSFGGNGLYRTIPSDYDFIELASILAAPGDKILLSGYVTNPSDLSGSLYVGRLLSNGSPDNSFNGLASGTYYKALNNDSTFLIPNGMALHPDSSIYIIGDAVNISSETSPFIIRIKPGGSIDSTISADGTGWYMSKYGGLDCSLQDISIHSDSTIYITGSLDNIGTNNDLLLLAHKRLPDTTGSVYIFNGDGLWTDAANWLDNTIPPVSLPNGATIIIDPVPGGTSILNIQQNIEPGGKIIVYSNAHLLIEGDLNIGN
ncbi:MAG: hypothetical protein QM687_13890 [Ferruginibacter sp.]